MCIHNKIELEHGLSSQRKRERKHEIEEWLEMKNPAKQKGPEITRCHLQVLMGLRAQKATQNVELTGKSSGNKIVLLKMKESQGNPASNFRQQLHNLNFLQNTPLVA